MSEDVIQAPIPPTLPELKEKPQEKNEEGIPQEAVEVESKETVFDVTIVPFEDGRLDGDNRVGVDPNFDR